MSADGCEGRDGVASCEILVGQQKSGIRIVEITNSQLCNKIGQVEKLTSEIDSAIDAILDAQERGDDRKI